MQFIPHTPDDITQMLDAIGVERIADLFDEIPAGLLNSNLPRVPEGLNEMQVTRLMSERAARDGSQLNFIGAGAYEHHIPAAVWQIATRGEFYSAYTPYQAEASQGTLQLLYEWQTMMASLTGMEVSNASLYDGASAVAEAVLMAVRVNKAGVHRVLIPANLHPFYRATLRTLLSPQKIAIAEIAFDPATGRIDQAGLEAAGNESFAALVINQPNFFGVLESPDALTDWAHANNIMVIASVNPTALGILKPPGEWNQSRVLVQGNHVEHWLNGTKVLEYELSSEPVLTAVQKSKFREVQGFGEKQNGHILLTYHNDPVSYRNIKVRPLAGRALPPPANFRVVQ